MAHHCQIIELFTNHWNMLRFLIFCHKFHKWMICVQNKYFLSSEHIRIHSRRRGIRDVILFTDSHCNWQYYEKTGWTLAAEHKWSFREEPIRALAYWKTI